MQLKIMWLFVVIVALLILVVTPGRTAGPTDPRLKIVVYRYGGPEGGSAFLQFHSCLRRKIRHLYTTMLDRSKDASYLKNLTVLEPKDHPPGSVADFETEWQTVRALEVLDGSIFKEQDGYWATTSIYLGDLADYKGFLPRKELVVEVRVNRQEYKRLFDSHSAVTLYALAIDALSSGTTPDNVQLVAKYLAQALDVLADLEGRNQMTEDLLLLRCAIAKARASLEGKPLDPDCL